MFGGLLKVFRKGRCQVCGSVTKDLLPEIPRRNGTAVDICAYCVADIVDHVAKALQGTPARQPPAPQEDKP